MTMIPCEHNTVHSHCGDIIIIRGGRGCCKPEGPQEPEQPKNCVCLQELSANLDLYVAPDGDDEANDGLSVETPLKTIAAALDKTRFYHHSLFGITINLAAGTYAESVGVDFRWHYPTLTIKGNSSLPVIGNGIFVNSNGMLVLEQVHITGTDAQRLVYAGRCVYMVLKTCKISANASSAYTVSSVADSVISIFDTLEITATATKAHLFCASTGGFILVNNDARVSLTGTVSRGTFCSDAFSRIYVVNGASFSGSVTGKRYEITGASAIYVGGGSINSLPGTIAGVVAAGSVYATA